ncbi:hypothetical protein [Streptomyces purpureus]|uniref:Uncharacterized protein n=1 Tax=Streptomyces purpureus TaxID=1951 RepID=A0A918LLL5_9ACTN|nr:hypothetical protein [Streptomyces purpureus]GGT13978.1 hypothetical protein GCM10014713_03210 [Streptomyces purpureus]
MTSKASRYVRVQHVTCAGTALASALLPLAVGVLMAKAMAADPLTPVNALITGGGHRARIPRCQWRRCGRAALRLRPRLRRAV